MIRQPIHGGLARRLLVVMSRCVGIIAFLALVAGPAPALAQAPSPDAQQDGREDGTIAVGRTAAWDTADDRASQAGAVVPLGLDQSPNDCRGWPTRRVRYTSDGVIHLEGCGQTFTLTDVAAAPGVDASKLQLVDAANKIWLLKVKLKVEEGATLRVVGGAGGDASWLRLRSDSSTGIWLRAENGNLLLQDTKVTSWDTAKNDVDTDVSVGSNGSGGRSYIAARSVLTKGRPTAAPTACGVSGGTQEPYESRMDVVNSEIGYLGYNAAESYGIIWKVYYKVDASDPNDAPPPGRQLYAMVDIFGDVSASTFHHNYFGSYTYGAYCMNWTGSTFADNIQYGLDPHDDSDYLTISGNTFRNNGNHGVICSVECNNLVIANNQSTGNKHGIMIHRNVNGALVEGNTVTGNREAGIAIFDSHDAIVRGNTVTGNGIAAVRLSVGSTRNLIENNTLTGPPASATTSGYVIYTYKGSDPPTSGDGRPRDNTFRDNRLTGYKSPLVKIGESDDNLFERNTILGPATDIAFSKATGNVLRDSAVGRSFLVKLDSTSKVRLEDTQGHIWQLSRSGLATSAEPALTRLELTSSNTGGSVTATTIDLTVRPLNGMVTVEPTTWNASSRTWTERSTTTSGEVAHTVGGLQPNACYNVAANSRTIGTFGADPNGRITFAYAGGYTGTVTFVVGLATCSAPSETPLPTVYLPLLVR